MAQVDPQTFATNLTLILGGIFLLIGLFLASVALITSVRCMIWIHKRRRADAEHRHKTRRTDGKMYPPQIEGKCSKCRRGDRKIYMAGGGNELCPACYEEYWRKVEGWEDSKDAEAKTARPDVPNVRAG